MTVIEKTVYLWISIIYIIIYIILILSFSLYFKKLSSVILSFVIRKIKIGSNMLMNTEEKAMKEFGQSKNNNYLCDWKTN